MNIKCPELPKVKLRDYMIRYFCATKKLSVRVGSKNLWGYKEHDDFFLKSLFDSMKVSKKGFIQTRELKAQIMQGIPTQKDLRLCCSNNSHVDLSNGHNKAQVLIDIKKLVSTTNAVLPQQISRKRFNDIEIEHSIKFIFSKDHIRTLSWGVWINLSIYLTYWNNYTTKTSKIN